MAIQINRTTIRTIGTEQIERLGLRETVEVAATFAYKTQTITAYRYPESKYNPETLYLRGFVGRYVTSAKAWQASVRVDADDKVWVHFGRDDRSGRFNKANMIRYEPTAEERAAL